MNTRYFTGIIIIAALVSVILPLTVTAQQFQRPTPESMVERIEHAVTITAEQRAQILKFYTDVMANMGQGGGRGGRGGFAFMGGSQTPEAIAKILTAEQIEKLEAYNLQQSIDRRIEQIDRTVTLTDEQKAKIAPVIRKEIEAQNKLMAEMSGQGQNADFQSMRDNMMELRDVTTKALESILNKKQLSEYNNMPRFGRRGQ